MKSLLVFLFSLLAGTILLSCKKEKRYTIEAQSTGPFEFSRTDEDGMLNPYPTFI
jgi:hypothetical protein